MVEIAILYRKYDYGLLLHKPDKNISYIFEWLPESQDDTVCHSFINDEKCKGIMKKTVHTFLPNYDERIFPLTTLTLSEYKNNIKPLIKTFKEHLLFSYIQEPSGYGFTSCTFCLAVCKIIGIYHELINWKLDWQLREECFDQDIHDSPDIILKDIEGYLSEHNKTSFSYLTTNGVKYKYFNPLILDMNYSTTDLSGNINNLVEKLRLTFPIGGDMNADESLTRNHAPSIIDKSLTGNHAPSIIDESLTTYTDESLTMHTPITANESLTRNYTSDDTFLSIDETLTENHTPSIIDETLTTRTDDSLTMYTLSTANESLTRNYTPDDTFLSMDETLTKNYMSDILDESLTPNHTTFLSIDDSLTPSYATYNLQLRKGRSVKCFYGNTLSNRSSYSDTLSNRSSYNSILSRRKCYDIMSVNEIKQKLSTSFINPLEGTQMVTDSAFSNSVLGDGRNSYSTTSATALLLFIFFIVFGVFIFIIVSKKK